MGRGSAAAGTEFQHPGVQDLRLAGWTHPTLEDPTQTEQQLPFAPPDQPVLLVNPNPSSPLKAPPGQTGLSAAPWYTMVGAEEKYSLSSTCCCQCPTATLWEGGGSLRTVGASPMVSPLEACNTWATGKQEETAWGLLSERRWKEFGAERHL